MTIQFNFSYTTASQSDAHVRNSVIMEAAGISNKSYWNFIANVSPVVLPTSPVLKV